MCVLFIESKSQLKSPVITRSLFSLSIKCRLFSNLSRSSIGEFGGRYHVDVSRGLLLGCLISMQIFS